MQTLVYESYRRYGGISSEAIEERRLKHRLRVISQLEKGLEKNAIRCMLHDGYYSAEELQVNVLKYIGYIVHIIYICTY